MGHDAEALAPRDVAVAVKDDSSAESEALVAAPGAEVAPSPEKDAAPEGINWRAVLLLAGCWSMGVAAVFIQISSTSAVAAEMWKRADPNNPGKFIKDVSRTTVPLGVLIGVASLSSTLVQWSCVRYGQFATYIVASLLGIVGAVLNYVAVDNNDYTLLIIGSVPQGITYAATNALRFSVAHFAPKSEMPRAMSVVLLGGVLSGVLGPEMTKHLYDQQDTKFLTNYVWLACLYAVKLILHVFIPYGPIDTKVLAQYREDERLRGGETDDEKPAEASDVASRPNRGRSLTALFCGHSEITYYLLIETISYSVMGGVMAATPSEMNADGFSFEKTNTTVMLHTWGMFLPGLVSGRIIKRIGTHVSMALGMVVMMAACGIYYISDNHASYSVGMFVVGAGWNFAFVAASSAFSSSLARVERLRALALNDTIVLGVLCICMVSAGFFLDDVGWHDFLAYYLGFAGFGLLLVLGFAFFNSRK